jgi:hypothetical protein
MIVWIWSILWKNGFLRVLVENCVKNDEILHFPKTSLFHLSSHYNIDSKMSRTPQNKIYNSDSNASSYQRKFISPNQLRTNDKPPQQNQKT